MKMSDPLTLSQINSVLDTVLGRTKFDLAPGPEALLREGLVALGMLTQLQEVKIPVGKLDQFIELLAQRYLISQVDPGTPIGPQAALATGAAGTQGSLNSIHGGSQKALNAGFPRFQELVNATASSRNPSTQLVFSERQTSIEIHRHSGEFIETTFGQLVRNFDIIERPEEDPEWVEIFMKIYYPDLEELPPTDHVLKLYLDMDLMYAREVLPHDLIRVLQKDRPDDLVGLYAPLEEGVLYIYPDQDRVAEQAQSAMDSVQSKNNTDSEIRLSSAKKVLYALNVDIVPLLGKLLVTGIPGILYLESEELTMYPTQDRVHRLCWSKRATPKDLDEVSKPRWRVNPESETLYRFGLTITDLLEFFEDVSEPMETEFNPVIVPMKVIATSTSIPNMGIVPSFVRKVIKVSENTPEVGFSTIEIDVDSLLRRSYHPRSALDKLLSMGVKMVNYNGTHLILEKDPSTIQTYIDEIRKQDMNHPMLAQALFVYADAYGINSNYIRKSPLVLPELCRPNNVWEVYRDAGIEAARAFLIREISQVLVNSGIPLQPAYTVFIVDYITRTGEPTGLNYFGIVRQGTDTIQVASFERPTEAYRSTVFGSKDPAASLTGFALTGRRPGMGTGSIDMIPDVSVQSLRAALSEARPDPVVTNVVETTPVEATPVALVTRKARQGGRRLRSRNVEISETPTDDAPLVAEAGLAPVAPAAAEEMMQGNPTVSTNRPRRRAVLKKS